MQQTEEAATESETKRLRRLRFETQRGIVQLQLFQRLAQRAVIARINRVQAGEYLRLDFLEAGQRLGRGAVGESQGIADKCGLQLLDTGRDQADFTDGA